MLNSLWFCHDEQVQGSHEEREFDLERLGERGMLYYERYFYIAASATFLRGSSWPDDRDEEEEEATRLVLDVPQGTAVILMKKVRRCFNSFLLKFSVFYVCDAQHRVPSTHVEKTAPV